MPATEFIKVNQKLEILIRYLLCIYSYWSKCFNLVVLPEERPGKLYFLCWPQLWWSLALFGLVSGLFDMIGFLIISFWLQLLLLLHMLLYCTGRIDQQQMAFGCNCWGMLKAVSSGSSCSGTRLELTCTRKWLDASLQIKKLWKIFLEKGTCWWIEKLWKIFLKRNLEVSPVSVANIW